MSDVEHRFGHPTWRELKTTDVAKAKDFYAGLFGWTYRSEEMPEIGTYWLIVADSGQTIGGMWESRDASSSCWLTYISVADVETTARSFVAGGGTIVVAPREIPNAGLFTVVTDPFGAAIIAFKSRGGDPLPAAPRPGEFCWETLSTPSVVKAQEFYAKVFGWSVQRVGAPVFATGDRLQDRLADIQESTRSPSRWITYVAVVDAVKSRTRVSELGGTVVVPLVEVPSFGRVCAVQDPAGGFIALLERAPR